MTNKQAPDERLRWPCKCNNPPFDGDEYLANDGAIRCPNCHRPLSGDPAPVSAPDEGVKAPVEGVTALDANGEAMICEGCGSTKTIAAILASHGPKAIACCPERKMVEARYFWQAAQGTELPRLQSENLTLKARDEGWRLQCEEQADELTRLQSDNARLREALAPFAEKAAYADGIEADDRDYLEHAPMQAWAYRKARAALTLSEGDGE